MSNHIGWSTKIGPETKFIISIFNKPINKQGYIGILRDDNFQEMLLAMTACLISLRKRRKYEPLEESVSFQSEKSKWNEIGVLVSSFNWTHVFFVQPFQYEVFREVLMF